MAHVYSIPSTRHPNVILLVAATVSHCSCDRTWECTQSMPKWAFMDLCCGFPQFEKISKVFFYPEWQSSYLQSWINVLLDFQGKCYRKMTALVCTYWFPNTRACGFLPVCPMHYFSQYLYLIWWTSATQVSSVICSKTFSRIFHEVFVAVYVTDTSCWLSEFVAASRTP